VVNPSTRLWDPGFFQLENDDHRYRDWVPQGHGWVTLASAIRDSCDTFYYKLAVELGIDRISEGMRSFGFGDYTNIDMGEEVPALMPDRGWKQATQNVRWFPGETVIIGIGQGYWTSTPLQLAAATAAIANDGWLYPLSIVNSIAHEDHRVMIEHQDKRKPIFDFEPENMQLVQNAMKAVNQYPGTAWQAFRGAPFTSAGKSGTAQLKSIAQDEEYDEESIYYRLRDNALFVAYAPFEEPTIAVAVIVENAGGGSANAAPIARQVMEHYLEITGQL
jgi:penicillin-binding protein 2